VNYKSVNEQKPREIAWSILSRSESERVHADVLLADALPRLVGPDRALCQELVYGVIRWRLLLDWLIAGRTEGRKQKPEVQWLLRMGLYQLLWLDRVPDHAIVFEAVELTRRQGFAPHGGFVNAVLRTCARDRAALRAEIERLRQSDPALGWSHPGWLVDRWRERWGDDSTRALLEWNNRPAETFARVNTLRTDPGRLLDRWRMEEKVAYDFVRADWLEESSMFRLESHPPLTGLGSFREGWFYVQDPSTILAVTALNPQPGDRILDLCAAPGGKATAIAQRVANQGLVIARDTVAQRLERVRENCERLGAKCVVTELMESDGAVSKSGLRFDRVLVDAPCSNTGVIRRRVESRWGLSAEVLNRLAQTQHDLLGQGAAQLQRGGTLVYSTCSLEPEENGVVVRRFMNDHPGFELVSERELWPFRDGFDGVYVAVLRSRPR
jgi:16S rRNA (cytosine967-C5)-methyltransferase